YATYVEKNIGGCGGMIHSIDPDDSDLFLLTNVNSYYYIHTGGAITFHLDYLTTNPLPNEPDLDFYIFNEGGELDSMSDLVGASFNDYDDDPVSPEDETINYSNLQAGKYLLVV